MNIDRIAKRAVAGGMALVQMAGHAAPYVLAQEPRNLAVKEPAPNVVVSVDNSVSMEWSSLASDGNVNPVGGLPSRMEALQNALRSSFSEANIPDESIRLAWQAMNNNNSPESCAGFFGDDANPPYRAGKCTINARENANLMRPLDSTHRANFMRWVDRLRPAGGTPLHAMMTRAGEYMKTTGAFNPYSEQPGTADARPSSCRRSFHIFMTDGEYTLFGFANDPQKIGMPPIGNADGTPRVLPDGVEFAPVPPFRDAVGSTSDPANWQRVSDDRWRPTAEYRPTLADMAFHYWATDLQPDLPNDLNKSRKGIVEPGEATIGNRTVSEYWNPKNNPASWQHLTTHVVGFGSASSWVGSPSIAPDAQQPTYSGDYKRLVDGSIAWPDPLVRTFPTNRLALAWQEANGGFGYEHVPRIEERSVPIRMDLWHAALNGRGSFTPANNAEALGKAFDSILSRIVSDTSSLLSSIAADSSKLSTDTVSYQAGYDTLDWSGTLKATRFNAEGRVGDEPLWSAEALLNSRTAAPGGHGSRTVLSFSRPEPTTLPEPAPSGAGVAFRWERLSQAQQGSLKSTSGTEDERTAHGRAVLDFLRGDRSNERPAGLKLRRRGNVLGDIVGSAVVYVGQPQSGFTRSSYAAFAAMDRTPMVYVGANDGMLHAFDASSGNEAFAYVPEGLFGSAASPRLRRLSEPGYTHRYFVDGSPFVGDIYMGTATTPKAEQAGLWRSFLVGTLGAGGKGYFVLDVTRPQQITEAEAASVALIDTTATADEDLGHQFYQPARNGFPQRASQITMLNNSRPALVLGNGYNSTNEKAVLWIQYLDGSRSVLKIPAPATQDAGTGNGLSVPALVDRDGDGKADFAYAGDLHGKLWKFDLSDADSNRWKASLGAGVAPDDAPLFAGGATRPITASPVVVAHPLGGFMVVFGTGRLFAAGDESDATPQYLIGVWDKANGNAGTAALDDLVAQAIAEQTVASGGDEYRAVSANEVTYGGAKGKRGWYIQLPNPKERMIYPGDVVRSRVGLFSSTVPGSSSSAVDCTPGTPDDGWTMLVDFFSGTAPDGVAYGGLVGNYLGYRNRSGRDDIAFRRDGQKIALRNASGTGKDAEVPSRVHRFGWRNLIYPN